MVPVTVFIVDDHEVVRAGLRMLLEESEDIKVVGEAGSATEALACIPSQKPEVAILDVRLPDGNGIEVCREIRSSLPDTACLMLTSYADDEALFASVMAGASGYVLKQIRGTDLTADIRRVSRGESLLDDRLIQQVLERIRAAEVDPLAALTNQERRILELIAEGKTNRQIGEEMYLAEKTIKNYVSNLLSKLGMESRTEAAVYATRLAGRANSIAPAEASSP